MFTFFTARSQSLKWLVIMMLGFVLLVQPVSAETVNGEYSIQYEILSADKKNASIAGGYWNQPAKVFIQDDSIRVQTTINKHAWVTKFSIKYNGVMEEVKTISVNEEKDARVTEFKVANFTDLVESNVSVYIEEIDYDHSYTMYFQFKPDTLTLVKADEKAAEKTTEKVDEKAVEKADAKPSTAPVANSTSKPDVSAPASPVPTVKPEAPAVAPSSSPNAPTPTSGVEKPAEEASNANQSETVLTATGASDEVESSSSVEEQSVDSSNEAAATEQSEEANLANENESDEALLIEETDVVVATSQDETEEKEENKMQNVGLVIAFIAVFIGLIAASVYLTRHNKK